MKDFRCKNQECHQLMFKYSLDGDILFIETKCYACNEFSTFTVSLNRVQHTPEILEDKKGTFIHNNDII